jgi:phosphatidylethanolamine-binding protein (PEBP) family uncharacterized protein
MGTIGRERFSQPPVAHVCTAQPARARTKMRRSLRHTPTALAIVAAALVVAGCGEGSGSSGSASGASSTAAGTPVAARSAARKGATSTEAVAVVAGTPIAKSELDHWTAVTVALSGSRLKRGAPSTALKDQALGFLITSKWVLGEAAAMGVAVSAAEASQRLDQLQAKQFPTVSALKKFYGTSGETRANLLERTKVEMLESKIAQRVMAGKTGAAGNALLDRFRTSFEARWRGRTSCRAGYVMEDCRDYKGPRHPPAAASSPAQASGASSRSASSGSAASSSAGAYSRPGAMSISSPAFEPNGAIPATYTCDGAGISPPLRWQTLPTHTAEMVLFVIDDSSDGTKGGTRWVVAGLTPSTTAIEAGKLPAGALVGLNSAGKATYGAICPAKGKTDRIEFVLWALSKKIALSSGFTPAVAEQEYSKSELASAVTYAVYSRH